MLSKRLVFSMLLTFILIELLSFPSVTTPFYSCGVLLTSCFLIYYFPALAKSSVGIDTPFYNSGLEYAPRVFLWPEFACYYGGSLFGQHSC